MIMEFIFSLIGFFLFWLLSCIKILREYERGVVFRLGRMLEKAKGPGLIFVFQPIDRMIRINTQACGDGCAATGYHHS